MYGKTLDGKQLCALLLAVFIERVTSSRKTFGSRELDSRWLSALPGTMLHCQANVRVLLA